MTSAAALAGTALALGLSGCGGDSSGNLLSTTIPTTSPWTPTTMPWTTPSPPVSKGRWSVSLYNYTVSACPLDGEYAGECFCTCDASSEGMNAAIPVQWRDEQLSSRDATNLYGSPMEWLEKFPELFNESYRELVTDIYNNASTPPSLQGAFPSNWLWGSYPAIEAMLAIPELATEEITDPRGQKFLSRLLADGPHPLSVRGSYIDNVCDGQPHFAVMQFGALSVVANGKRRLFVQPFDIWVESAEVSTLVV